MNSDASKGSRLLARLPKAKYSRLFQHLRFVEFPPGQILYEARSAIDYAYFPNRGTSSAVVVMQDGQQIEVATIGNEGAIGVPTLIEAETSPNRVIVQLAGDGLRIEASLLGKEADRSKPLRILLARYHAAFLFQMSQTVACNGLHLIEQRCCRLLLMTQDRVQSEEISVTQEFLAGMIGVRRASIADALRPLQRQGLIATGRGKISVTNRKGLEAVSCECYGVVRDEYKRLLG
jgi:CRP-like cAMP-binding protein